jgi:hypothetical protein
MDENPTPYQCLNRLVTAGEARFGRWGWSLLVVLLLMLAAAVYVRPGTNYYGHGVYFEALSRNPLDLRNGNVLGYRILTPLLAYLVGLRGRSFILLNLVFAAVTIGAVYRYFRTRAKLPGDALFGAMCLTFSSVVLITIYYAGFCDAFTYLSVFIMWRWRHRPLVMYPFLLLGVLNHEGILFVVPWFVYLKLTESPRKMATVAELAVGLGVVLVIFVMFRRWLSLGRDAGMFAGAYLTPLLKDPMVMIQQAHQYYWLGFFGVFKALWLIPVVAAVGMWKGGRKKEVYGMIILTICTAAQLLIAYDTTRMLTLGFMVIIISLEYLFVSGSSEFRRWAPWVFIFNLFVPQLFTAARVIEIMHSLPSNLLRMLLEKGPYWVG